MSETHYVKHIAVENSVQVLFMSCLPEMDKQKKNRKPLIRKLPLPQHDRPKNPPKTSAFLALCRAEFWHYNQPHPGICFTNCILKHSKMEILFNRYNPTISKSPLFNKMAMFTP